MRIVSPSPRTTQLLAKTLAEELSLHPPSFPHATVIALEGPLGAGKTAFAQGFARAMGVRRNLPSPTFVFMRRYPLRPRSEASPLRKSHYKNLFHVDAYRVRNASKKTLAPLGLIHDFKDPANIFLIEWANHIARTLPRRSLHITFRHLKTDPLSRALAFRAYEK